MIARVGSRVEMRPEAERHVLMECASFSCHYWDSRPVALTANESYADW